jgi:hypothetical protein
MGEIWGRNYRAKGFLRITLACAVSHCCIIAQGTHPFNLG